MKTFIPFLLSILMLSGKLSAQQLPGSWHNAANKITITMMTDGSFLTRSGQNLITGTYSRLGNYLSTQDPSGQYAYQISRLTQDELVMTDAHGNVLALERMKTPVNLPVPSRYPAVLASQGRYQVTESDIRMGVATIEFLTAKSLATGKIDRLRASALEDFEKDPKEFTKGMKLLHGIMEQVALYSDPIAIALLRSRLYGLLYAANMSLAEADRSDLVNITVEELPVAAYDPQTQLVLSQNDLESALIYLDKINKVQGQQTMSASQKEEIREFVKNNFQNLSQLDQQFYVNASIFAEMIDYQLNHFNPQQQQQLSQNWQQQPAAAIPNWGNQVNNQMDPDTYRFLSRLSLQNHVSMMNGIEAIGGSSDYWEIKPSYLGNW